MKTLKKSLCVILSILMAFSCLSIVSFAEGETVTSSFKYYAEKNDAYNAKVTLDKVDELLKKANIYEEVTVTSSIKFVIDLRSVNALCGTIDKYEGLIRAVLLADPFGLVLGDLKDINLRTWEDGMTRTTDDVKIIKELIELVAANKGLVSGICDATLDLGVFENYINLSEIFGPDGVSGMLKELLIGIVYQEGTAEYNNAYNKYKNNFDAFLYGDLLSKYTNTYLPGFTMSEDSTIENVICNAFDIAIDKYVVDLVKKLNVDLATSSQPVFKALDGIVNLKGSTYDLSGVKLDSSKSLLSQINGVVGAVVKQMVPAYTGWTDGNYDKLADNLEAAVKYVATQSGLIANAGAMSFEEVIVKAAVLVFESNDFGYWDDGLKACATVEEMITRLLLNVADHVDMGVTYSDDEDYLVILGDMFAYWFYDYFNVTDLNGKPYQAGGGKDLFEVANYFMNYFLFGKGTAALSGLSTTKGESIFTKVDKILDYFGETKAKGVSFDSKKFIYGTASEKGILEAILTLDIESILELTLVPALNTAGDVSAVEFLYKTVQYGVNNWAGKTLFPKYQKKAFNNALSNQSIANMASVLLEVANARKDSLVSVAVFTIGLIFEGEPVVYTVDEATIEDCVATGERVAPKATVVLSGKTLTNGVDYIVSTRAVTPGTAKATIKLLGVYEGKLERSFNVTFGSVTSVDYLSNSNSAKLVWGKVPFADGYNIYLNKNDTYERVNDELITNSEFMLSGLAGATDYSVKLEAVSSAYGTSQAKEINLATSPDAISSGIKTATDASRARFVWTAVKGATHYRIEKYVGSNKWEEVQVTDKTDVIISGLDSYTEYNFRITALKKSLDGKYVASTPVSVKVKTALGAIEKLSTAYTSTSITLKWNAVKNAQKYQVLQNVGGKWKSVRVFDAKTTSYKITGLKPATKYTYAVRAAVSENGKWIFGGYKTVAQYTGLAVPTNFKVVATNANAAKISWSKVANAKGYEVFQYVSGKWASKGMTKNTSATIKGLPSGQKSYFRVRAVTTLNGKYHYSDATAYITALTLPAQVTGVKLVVRSTNSISFSWNKVTGASGYQIFRWHNGKWVSLGMTTKLNYTDSKSMSKGVEYQYRVRAVQKVGSSYKYGAASATFKAKTTLVGSSRL